MVGAVSAEVTNNGRIKESTCTGTGRGSQSKKF